VKRELPIARVALADHEVERVGDGRGEHQRDAERVGAELPLVEATDGEEDAEIGEGDRGQHLRLRPSPLLQRDEQHDDRRVAEHQHPLDAGVDHRQCPEVEQGAAVVADEPGDGRGGDRTAARGAHDRDALAGRDERPEERHRDRRADRGQRLESDVHRVQPLGDDALRSEQHCAARHQQGANQQIGP
jgi:hypothetical protein